MDRTRNCPPNTDPRTLFRRAIERIRPWWGVFGSCLGCGLLVGLGLSAANAGEPPASAYVVRAEPVFYARIHRDETAVLSGVAHEHVVRATRIEIAIQLNEQAPEACRATLMIPVRSLLVDEPAWRQRVGLSDRLDDQDRESVREHMLAPDQLDAARFPQIRATVDRCRKGNRPGTYRADLHLTLHGVTKAFRGAALVTLEGGRLECRGQLRTKHSDFGIEPYSAFLGTVRNADTFDLHWSVGADPVPPKGAAARPGP